MTGNTHRAAGVLSVIAAAFVAVGTVTAGGGPQTRFVSAQDPGRATVDGTSSLHDWTVKTKQIEGSAVFPGRWAASGATTVFKPDLAAAGADKEATDITLTIPVDSLKSGDGGMDDTMYHALKRKKHPQITYHMTKATLTDEHPAAGQPYRFKTVGELTIAGKMQPIELTLEMLPRSDGGLTISTTKALEMTDFGIKPPTAMFGIISSGAKVTVNVTWQLKSQTPEPTLPQYHLRKDWQAAVSSVADAYVAAQSSLAAGQTDKATAALASLKKAVDGLDIVDLRGIERPAQAAWSNALADLRGAANAASGAGKPAEQRDSFLAVSKPLMKLLENFPRTKPDYLYGFECRDKPGGVWLQDTAVPHNPYAAAGSDGSACGTLTKILVADWSVTQPAESGGEAPSKQSGSPGDKDGTENNQSP